MSQNHLRQIKRAVKRERGVSLGDLPVCLPAAVDGVSRADLTVDGYNKHIKLFEEQVQLGPSYRRAKIAWRNVLEAVGSGTSIRSLSNRATRTLEETDRALKGAREGGRRVVIFTNDQHVVGLRPVHGGWKAEGSSTPFQEGEVLTVEEIHSRLAKPLRRYGVHGKLAPNIVTLPSEPKKRK